MLRYVWSVTEESTVVADDVLICNFDTVKGILLTKLNAELLDKTISVLEK